MIHSHHSSIMARLKRAHGHLASVIEMMEAGRPCADLAQQLHAVEKAIAKAKRELVQDHIDHCLEDAVGQGGREAKAALAELRSLSKYL